MKSSFFNSRINAVLFLGFSSGLPLALTGSTLQAWFTQTGIDVVTIGALSLVGIPYAWKFLWAPLMDRFMPPCWGKRRGWILVTQLGLCATIAILAQLSPNTQPVAMGLLALLIAFISASQDIAIDAYRTNILESQERGFGLAATIMAMRIALLISGGGALIFADHFGWCLTYELMALLIAANIIVTYFAPDTVEVSPPPSTNLMAVATEAFTDLLSRESIGLLLLFVVFYKIGDALALALMSNFLLHGLGFSLTEVGFAYKTVGLFATIAGGLLGGVLLMRMNLYRALMLFGVAQGVTNFMFMLLAMIGKNYSLLVGSVFLESFCSGMGTAAFLAFITSLCDRRFSATQFALWSALASIGRIIVGPIAGVIVKYAGWTSLFGWSVVISVPGMMLLWLLRNRVSFHVEAVA